MPKASRIRWRLKIQADGRFRKLLGDCLIWLSVWEDFCTVVVTKSLETKWLASIWSGNWIIPRGLFPLQDVNPSVAETQLFEGEHWLKDVSYLALRTYDVQFPKHLWMSSLGGEFRLEDGINMIHQRIPEIGLVYSTQSTPSTRFSFFSTRVACSVTSLQSAVGQSMPASPQGPLGGYRGSMPGTWSDMDITPPVQRRDCPRGGGDEEMWRWYSQRFKTVKCWERWILMHL